MLACSLSVGLLTLCWPPSLSVGVPEPGSALCHTPLRTHPQIRPCLGLYAELSSLAPPPSADLVSDHRFGLAVLAGPRPAYLRDLCCPTSSAQGRRSLCSTERGVLMVPFARTATKQNRAFSMVGPSLWNGLPLALRLHPKIHSEFFYSCLKTVLFSCAWVGSAPE